MKIYSTLTNRLEDFIPVEPGKVSMYVCGPTTWNYIHIGNARPVIFFDVVRRYFTYLGYDVTFVSNLTDLNDKIYAQSIKENISEMEVAKKYIDYFFKDVQDLNSLMPDIAPKVTEYIPQITEYVQRLIDAGVAYESNGDIYFRVNNVSNYGSLSGQKLEELNSGARVDVNDKKENPMDFMLWKNNEYGFQYEADFGNGRPGWHTECSCMIEDIFNSQIDIHGGGSDLRFPHHENEMAQSFALNNHSLAKIWMHNGRIDLANQKMSKSLGNIIWVKDLLEKYDASAYRLLVLAHSYRSQISFSYEQMDIYQKEYEKILRTYKQLFTELDLIDGFTEGALVEEFVSELKENMNNDFSTPNVVTSLYQIIKEINKALRSKEGDTLNALYNTINLYFDILGIEVEVKKMDTETKNIYKSWLQARKDKDFAKADELRDKLQELGVI